MRLLRIIPLALLVALVASSAQAWMTTAICGGGVPVAGGTTAYCTAAASCTATNPGECDILCEDFEGSSECDADSSPDMDAVCRNQYAVTIGTSCAVDFTSTATGTYPCASTTNNNVLKMTSSGTNSAQVFFDAGAAKPINYTQVYFKVNSESLSSGQSATIAQGCTASNCSTYAWRVFVRDSAGTIYLDYEYYNGTSFTTKQGTTAIGTTNWHRLNVKHDYTNLAAEYWIDGVSEGSGVDVGNRQPRYFGLRGGGENTVDVEFDNWAIDATAIQGACLN